MHELIALCGFITLLLLVGPDDRKIADINCPGCKELNARDDFDHKSVKNKIGRRDAFQKVESLKNRKKYMSSIVSLAPIEAKTVNAYEAANQTHADVTLMNSTFLNLFAYQRNSAFDLKCKKKVRKIIINALHAFGLLIKVQKFSFSFVKENSIEVTNAENLIGILPSERYKKSNDKILVIGAHYDTVYQNPGVDDNGSGSTAVLECARVLSKHKGKLDATIYFVLFDEEETGLHGSIAFVDEYLVPKVLETTNSTFVGAFIADMILSYDDTPFSAKIPDDMYQFAPEAIEIIKNNSNRGDYIAVEAREADRLLWQTLQETWSELPSQEYKLIVVKTSIPSNYWNMTENDRNSYFVMSDHASFWQSARKFPHVDTLPAVLLSDEGEYRGYQSECYHKSCDNKIQLNEKNLQFMAKVVNAVIENCEKRRCDKQKLMINYL
ncbi:hypothetical protein B4U79_02555 [Dinothrombium tinctorium]|uniref:Peptidase M28 domain-containing protein n=1 Tax=Dinothrombium tinctorium TaxID=1965070 RepID=A0A3S3NTE5_9ACAR|nr:hypothetical protein B4U79_02555 [Dinothrombium tinctorium]